MIVRPKYDFDRNYENLYFSLSFYDKIKLLSANVVFKFSIINMDHIKTVNDSLRLREREREKERMILQ